MTEDLVFNFYRFSIQFYEIFIQRCRIWAVCRVAVVQGCNALRDGLANGDDGKLWNMNLGMPASDLNITG